MKTLEAVKIEDVTRTYNGEALCACGCSGSYTAQGDMSATVKRRVAFINKNLDRATVDYWVDEYCIEVENEKGTRVTRVYVKAAEFGYGKLGCGLGQKLELVK